MVQSTAASWRDGPAAAARSARRKDSGYDLRTRAGARPDQLAAGTDPLLTGKLTTPRGSSRLVQRPHLLALLDAGARRLLTLVSAPAGAGKTTLLASWSSSGQVPWPLAWLSLDARDNDPARFWTYVLAALRGSGGLPVGSALRALAPGPAIDETFLPRLISGLSKLPSPVILLLDDVHEITDPAVVEGLRALLRGAPPQLRVVMATRADPPLPLQRLAIGGELTQIRAADLAFTVAEVAELLAEYPYRALLSDDDLRLLQARTEGWAAGLRLVALSLQRQPNPRRFIAELAGDDMSIADYLVAEVLDRLPDRLRGFLLQTCVVDQLTGELADALTGGHDGEWTLSRLERANAFVVALGSRRAAFRYHRLFAELLRYELRRLAPHEIPELHRRAARWYAGRGLAVEAIRHALAAEDWREAADLIAEHGLRLAMRGDAATLRNLVGRLPAEMVAADPELALLAAAERIVSCDPEAARSYLGLATRGRELLRPERRDRFAVRLAACRAAFARSVGDLDGALAAGHAALAVQPRGQAGGSGDGALAVTLANLGAAELWTGDLAAAEPHLRDARTVAARAGLVQLLIDCASHLALLHAMRGELGQAQQLALEGIELAGRHGCGSPPRTAAGHLALAWVQYERDDLPRASHSLEQAVAASQADRERPVTLAITIAQARVRRAWGDLAGSLTAIESARRDLAGWRPPTPLWRWLMLTEAELRGAAGRAEPARALLASVRASLVGAGPLRAPDAVALACVQLAEGDPAAAVGTLAPHLGGTAPAGSLPAPLTAWLVDALARDALAERERAAASLEHALALAERESARRSFLDAGAPVRSLLARYRDRIPAVASYLDTLLRAAAEPATAVTAPPPRLLEPLTERELVVLRYLPAMMTYEEIALELYVSPNTIKTQVQSIFRKLGVSGRRQAVLGARRYQLL